MPSDMEWDYLLRPTYWSWVRSEAACIGADGCSGPAMGFHIECCMEHDLGYYYARDARDAYLKHRGGALDPWTAAKPIDRAEVDRRFRQCHRNRSRLGNWSPMAWYRWAAVAWRGGSRWDAHRAREKANV